MLIVADTWHGNFREVKTFEAESAEEFIAECHKNVGYISSNTKSEILAHVWEELFCTGTSYYGWTDFTVKV